MDKKHLNPRKQPAQSRSQMTVNTILEATAHILVTQRYAGVTTNAVAELAGVSIGSLYQYFPNKDALIYSLYQRHYGKMQAVLSKEMKQPLDIFCKTSIHTLVQAIVKAHLVEPVLHQRFEEVQEYMNLPKELDKQGFSVISQHLSKILSEHKTALHLSDTNASVFVLIHTVHALVHAIVRDQQSSEYIQTMIGEITRMVYGYIRFNSSS